jgi:putative oxidoreductase
MVDEQSKRTGMEATILPRHWTPYVQAIFRIMIGLLFLQHGLSKLVGFPPMNLGGMPEGLKIVAGLIETVGGALLIVGFATRPVAFVMSGFAAAAYFMAHFPRGFFPALNGGDAAILFCFASLFLAASGAGAWALDSQGWRQARNDGAWRESAAQKGTR